MSRNSIFYLYQGGGETNQIKSINNKDKIFITNSSNVIEILIIITNLNLFQWQKSTILMLILQGKILKKHGTHDVKNRI